MINKKRTPKLLLLLSSALGLVGCTRACVGVPELGSKKRPVRFYIDGWDQNDESVRPFKRLSSCIEDVAGYRVAFEIAADERAVAAALGRQEADLGFMSALGYLDATEKHGLQSQLVVTKKGEPSTRSVILGKASRWRTSLSPYGITLSAAGLRSEMALSPISTGRFVYLSPESDVGFFVPRHLLYQRNVFPEEAVFSGSFELVMQSIDRDIAIAGAVSESFLEEKFPNSTPVQIGSIVSEYVILAASQGLPGKIVVARKTLPSKVTQSIVPALDECSKGETKVEFEKIFKGDGVVKTSEHMFDFLQELQSFQSEYVRVLSPQEP